MSDSLSIISLVSSAVITPTVVAGYALYRQRLEQLTAAEGELRDVLDNAAEKLEAVLVANEQVDTLWRSGVGPDDETAKKARSERTQAIFSARTARDRIAMRVPTDTDVYTTYSDGLRAADAYAKSLRGFLKGEAFDEADEINQLRTALMGAQFDFMSAVRARVGVHRYYRWPSPLWPSLPLPPGRTS